MEKYRLVREHKTDETEEVMAKTSASSSSLENIPEVRITQQGKPRAYISFGMNLFESGAKMIVLKAMGRAINKAVTIAEILKRKLPLHQINTLTSMEMVDVYEPIEEGLDVVTSRRYVSCMLITLSMSAKDLDTKDPGYQPPLPEDEMHNSAIPPADYPSPLVPST